MMCPICGEKRSSVLETRLWMDDTVLKRRRECFNGHRYSTFEVTERLIGTIKKYSSTSAKAIVKVSEMKKRNKQILRDVKNGMLLKEVSEKYGLSESSISGIISALAPDFDVRSNSQFIRRKREKFSQHKIDPIRIKQVQDGFNCEQ